ncbi:MAG TPA: hypothetical protein VN611_02490 [Patescibacteria group bacterium]|nr:hypothetical protein [Patescibacteria group bacterium]
MSLIQGMLEEEYQKWARQLIDYLRGPASHKQQRAMATLREDMAFVEAAFIANQVELPNSWGCDSRTEIIYGYPAVYREEDENILFSFYDWAQCQGRADNWQQAEKLAAASLLEAITALVCAGSLPPEPTGLDAVKAAVSPAWRVRIVTVGKPYTVLMEPVGSDVTVRLPELPGCRAQGNHENEARAALATAKADWLERLFRERSTKRQTAVATNLPWSLRV